MRLPPQDPLPIFGLVCLSYLDNDFLQRQRRLARLLLLMPPPCRLLALSPAVPVLLAEGLCGGVGEISPRRALEKALCGLQKALRV